MGNMEIEGTIVNRNNRAKEQVLYKVIAEREKEIEAFRQRMKEWEQRHIALKEEIAELQSNLRTLKSKEYRRTVRRKKQKVGESTND